MLAALVLSKLPKHPCWVFDRSSCRGRAPLQVLHGLTAGLLQVVDMPEASGPKQLEYDAAWLAILRESHHLLSVGSSTRLPASWQGGAWGWAHLSRSGKIRV